MGIHNEYTKCYFFLTLKHYVGTFLKVIAGVVNSTGFRNYLLLNTSTTKILPPKLATSGVISQITH
jgi:hypothetical protein